MNLIFVYDGGWSKVIKENIIFYLVGEMSKRNNLGALMNADGTAGIQNDIKGDIVNTYELGKSTIYHVTKFCPSCPKGVEQPTNHVVISRGLNNVSYMCDVCGDHYYYLKSEVWGFIPEAQMKYYGLPDYEKKVNRKPYELHYLEARECHWYEVIDLNVTTITPGIWTAVTELSAQIFHKNIDGYAPGRLMGQFLKNGEETTIPEELGPKMQQSMAWLKQMEYI